MELRQRLVAAATGAVPEEQKQHFALRIRPERNFSQLASGFLNMRNALRGYLILAAAACLAANAATAWAQAAQPAGQFIAVVGDVNIVGADGQRRPAARGAEFREGETIVTGSAALVQLRTADGALISVRGDTEVKLDRFAYSGKDDPQPSFVMSVVKGGFRTITGLIARLHRPGYEIRTASATIGVRGTDFEVVHVPPQAALPEAPAGTYNRVHDGATDLRNIARQSVLVNRDQTAVVALRGNVPPGLVGHPSA